MIMAQLKHLQIDFKAPYYTFGDLNKDTPAIWIACHGYGTIGGILHQEISSI